MRRAVAAPRRGGLAAVLILAVTAGCVTAPRKPAALAPWPQRRAQLQSLDPFELAGRVAVAAGTEGFTAHLDWAQRGARSTVDLNGPLGIGGVHVVADGQTLDVDTSQGKTLTSGEARTELASKLGFDPPLGSLRYWVLGVPDPASPAAETVGANQRLASLQQDGWQIDYSAYTAAGGDSLPQRMVLRRGDVRVRLIVDRWQP
jgi:outer membrane lipoprotein LolB